MNLVILLRIVAVGVKECADKFAFAEWLPASGPAGGDRNNTGSGMQTLSPYVWHSQQDLGGRRATRSRPFSFGP
jgi:hypothetical protein